jgi:hypothetical protein
VTPRDLSAAHFKETIYGNDNVLVYFWARLCAPCDLFTATYEASSGVAQVRLLPTLMAFKKGKPHLRANKVCRWPAGPNLSRIGPAGTRHHCAALRQM